MNCIVSNIETGTVMVHFDSEITKVVIVNISGAIEFEKLINTKNRFTINSKQFDAGQYLVQFIKTDKVIDWLKMLIRT